eukprot:s734_g10.t1
MLQLASKPLECNCERDRLSRGGAAKDAEDRTRELEAKFEALKEEKAEIESGLAQQKAELETARLAAAKAAEEADVAARELSEEDTEKGRWLGPKGRPSSLRSVPLGYERYLGDCQQRAADGQRELSFDEWAKQYEWRYDADERLKARKAFPECFSHSGPAPLPIEEWEVDYLTHKEIEKIMYRRQTEALGARRRAKEMELQKENMEKDRTV